MASSPISLLFLLFLLVITSKTASAKVCPTRRCSRSGPEIRFPFRIGKLQGERCGYEGFEVSCDERSRTILHLSGAGDFVVDTIEYDDQYVLLKDPNDCLPKRLLDNQFTISSSPFVAPDYEYFKVANCSSANSSTIGPGSGVARLECLSLERDMVVVVVTDDDLAGPWMLDQQCYLRTLSSPLRWQHPTNMSESIWLRWFEPDCAPCEAAKRRCGLKDPKSGPEVICTRKPGLWMVARFAMASLFFLPWFTCIFGFLWFLKIRVFVRRGLDRVSSNGNPGSAPSNNVNGEGIEVTRRNAVGVTGIDSPTIESYLKTQIDDLEQLPRPNDDVCAICLSKYERKEMIRTIPECEHYFHAYCIDRWLRKNASCPLCRNFKE